MILKMYAVVDRVSGIFDGPHKAVNEGQFLRSFADNCKDPNSQIAKHPEDFYAVELGTFNDATGDIVATEGGAKRVANATDFIVTEEVV
jgi:hypothetical protein